MSKKTTKKTINKFKSTPIFAVSDDKFKKTPIFAVSENGFTIKLDSKPMDEIDFSTTWYEEIYYWFWRGWDWMRMVPKEIKWFYQRGRYGFSDSDVWDIGAYIAGWLPDAIKQLRKNASGCPSNVFDNTRKHNQCWKWKKILKEIEDGFRAANDISCDSFAFKKKKYDKLMDKFNKGMNLFRKHFFALWD